MVLENETCHIEIKIDETYTVGSADNRHYDVTLNPCHYRYFDHPKTFSIHIDLFSKEYFIALIGSFYCYAEDCAVLEGDILTVLQNDLVTQINITDRSIIRYAVLDCPGCGLALYKVKKGYIIYGEIEIVMLDHALVTQWTFSGKNIFVSMSGKKSFELGEDSIGLYDFEDNYYEIDLDGKLIKQ